MWYCAVMLLKPNHVVHRNTCANTERAAACRPWARAWRPQRRARLQRRAKPPGCARGWRRPARAWASAGARARSGPASSQALICSAVCPAHGTGFQQAQGCCSFTPERSLPDRAQCVHTHESSNPGWWEPACAFSAGLCARRCGGLPRPAGAGESAAGEDALWRELAAEEQRRARALAEGGARGRRPSPRSSVEQARSRSNAPTRARAVPHGAAAPSSTAA